MPPKATIEEGLMAPEQATVNEVAAVESVTYAGFTVRSIIKDDKGNFIRHEERSIPNLQLNFNDKKAVARTLGENLWLAEEVQRQIDLLYSLPEPDWSAADVVAKNVSDKVAEKRAAQH